MIDITIQDGKNIVACNFSFSGKDVIGGGENPAALCMTYAKNDDDTARMLKYCASEVISFNNQKEYDVNATRLAGAPRYYVPHIYISTHHSIIQGLILNMMDACGDANLALADSCDAEGDRAIPAISYTFYEEDSARIKDDAPEKGILHLCEAHYYDGKPVNASGIHWSMINEDANKKVTLVAAELDEESRAHVTRLAFKDLARIVEKQTMAQLIAQNKPTDFAADESFFYIPKSPLHHRRKI